MVIPCAVLAAGPGSAYVVARPRTRPRRPGAPPCDPGLRLRPDHAVTGTTRPRPELAPARHVRGEPGPRHVVAPGCGYQRLVALRPGLPLRAGRTRAGHCQGLHQEIGRAHV